MKFISLFAGIGGIDLGLERAGMECVAQVEIDDYCTRVLEKHWPDVPRWRDIHEIRDGDLPAADLIAGGFPCQPVSYAGKRQAQDDDRWLWPEFFRVVRLVRPRYVLVENVPGLLTAGFDDVACDLAGGGYDFEWTRLSAADVGAPHLRNRIFVVAYSNNARLLQYGRAGAVPPQQPSIKRVCDDLAYTNGDRRHTGDGRGVVSNVNGECESSVRGTQQQPGIGGAGDVADSDGAGSSRFQASILGKELGAAWYESPAGRAALTHWGSDPADAPESPVGRVAHGIPRRVDRLRGLGNAVVPQVAEFVGRRIMSHVAL